MSTFKDSDSRSVQSWTLMLRAMSLLVDEIGPTVEREMTRVAQDESGLDWISHCYDRMRNLDPNRRPSATDPQFLLKVLRQFWTRINRDYERDNIPEFGLLIECRNQWAHLQHTDESFVSKVIDECESIAQQLGCQIDLAAIRQQSKATRAVAPQLQAVPLELVSIGEPTHHPTMPAVGLTGVHLMAYGPVEMPLYETVWALLQAAGRSTETPSEVREVLLDLPAGVLEQLGISITEESARWMNMDNSGIVSIDPDSLKSWVSEVSSFKLDPLLEFFLDGENPEASFGALVESGDPFDLGLQGDELLDDIDPFTGEPYDEDAKPVSMASLVAPPGGARTHIAGVEPPTGAIWYLTQLNDTIAVEADYFDCALLMCDTDPRTALVKGFTEWGRNNVGALLTELDGLERRADVEARGPDASWQGFGEVHRLAYTAADVWNRFALGAHTAPSGRTEVMVLARSLEPERFWNFLRNPVIVAEPERSPAANDSDA